MGLGGVTKVFRQLLLITAFVAPITAWFVYPPVRVLVPAFAPITCGEGRVCVDDPAQLPRAEALYADAIAFVNANIGQIDTAPKMYFCSTQACSEHFGWDDVAAYNVGVFGAVIKPDWWKPYIVRHELIHHLQNERFGMVNYVLNKPEWLLEGMAYSLSDDPRPIGAEIEGQKTAFDAWIARVGRENMWREAQALAP